MRLLKPAIAMWISKPAPIEPSWILEGNPEARSYALSTSACGTAMTLIWSCTEGKFNWYYDCDRPSRILKDRSALESEGAPLPEALWRR